jgi:putative transposase
MYNRGLAMKMEAWSERKENLSRYDISAHLPEWKASEETAWLAEVNAQSLQASLANLESAYSRFFRQKQGFPKFKCKYSKQSFHVPQLGHVGDCFVQIPKVGRIKAVISRPVSGKVKSVTISRTVTGKLFASVLSDDGLEQPEKAPVTESGTVGIDLGLKTFATLSTGEKIANPRHLKRSLQKLARAQRRCSRRVKGSSNRNKARHIVACVHEKVANQRNDFLHKLTTKLVRENQTNSFAIEDLAVKNMMQNHRLARSISDVGWGTFRTMLQYKADRTGKNVLVIGRFEPSSKLCPCGKVNSALKLSDRTWTCGCGKTHDRDVLAANNIKRMALHPQNKLLPHEMRESTLGEIVT